MNVEEPDAWYGDTPWVFQNPRAPLPAPGLDRLHRGALLFPTSGSSGQPKWVAHTRSSLLASAAGVNRHLQASAADRWLCALPTFHVGGAAVHARAALTNSPVFSLKGKWDAQHCLVALAEQRITLTSLVPTQLQDLVQAELHGPPLLRAIVVGGGALSGPLWLQARKLGWPVLPSYGLTEAGSQVATASLSSLNSPTPPTALQVLDHWETRAQPPAHLLEIRGHALFHGYYTKAVSEPADGPWSLEIPFEQDWFQCQDRVHITQNADQAASFLTWQGRGDRVIKVLGELMDLDYAEQTLSALYHAEVIIVAVPHERRGHELVAIAEPAAMEALPKAHDRLAAALTAYHATAAPFARITAGKIHPFHRSPLGKPLRRQTGEAAISS